MCCQFLVAIRAAMNQDPPRDTKELLKTEMQRWGRDGTGLKELRDTREMQTLMLVLSRLCEDRVEEAVDVIAQRAKSILSAKSPKGSWEKSQVLELLAGAGSVVPQGEIALTGLGAA